MANYEPLNSEPRVYGVIVHFKNGSTARGDQLAYNASEALLQFTANYLRSEIEGVIVGPVIRCEAAHGVK